MSEFDARDPPFVSAVRCPHKKCVHFLTATVHRDDMSWVTNVTFVCPKHGKVNYFGPFDVSLSKSQAEQFDPLFAELPPELMVWLRSQKIPITKLMQRYAWTVCDVCHKFGFAFSSARIPGGEHLEFETNINGHLHPPTRGEIEVWIPDKSTVHLSEATLFDKYMTAVNKSWSMMLSYVQQTKGAMDAPFTTCISARGVLWTREGNRQGICPKCGEPGTGLGNVNGERRFFHGPDRSCYLGMESGVTRKKVEETVCPKCAELGRESTSKGYRYFRHKNKVCYLGKVNPSPSTLVKETIPAAGVVSLASYVHIYSP